MNWERDEAASGTRWRARGRACEFLAYEDGRWYTTRDGATVGAGKTYALAAAKMIAQLAGTFAP